MDVYTIQREVGRLDNITVGLVGDLANGRTVRSLAYLLAKYKGIKIYFVAPDVVRMKVSGGTHVARGATIYASSNKIPYIFVCFWE